MRLFKKCLPIAGVSLCLLLFCMPQSKAFLDDNHYFLFISVAKEGRDTTKMQAMYLDGADPNYVRLNPVCKNHTPLMTAIHLNQTGCLDVIMWLLRHGARADAKDLDGNTALHYATRKNFVPAVELLIHYPNVDVTAQNNVGRNPFHVAFYNGCELAFKCLIAHCRGDVNRNAIILAARDKLGNTVGDLLAIRDHRAQLDRDLQRSLRRDHIRKVLRGRVVPTPRRANKNKR